MKSTTVYIPVEEYSDKLKLITHIHKLITIVAVSVDYERTKAIAETPTLPAEPSEIEIYGYTVKDVEGIHINDREKVLVLMFLDDTLEDGVEQAMRQLIEEEDDYD